MGVVPAERKEGGISHEIPPSFRSAAGQFTENVEEAAERKPRAQTFLFVIFNMGNRDWDSRSCAVWEYLLSMITLYPQLLFMPAEVRLISELICCFAKRSCAMAAVV